MTEQRNISNKAWQEHLAEMAERLLDDELVSDPEKAKLEIEKAKAIQDLASQSIQIQKTDQDNKRILIEAMRVAAEYNYSTKEFKEVLGIEAKHEKVDS